jgi:tetratricopeptide (TPR) repeat protein
MANDEVLSRKDLKAPDKFQEVARKAVDWIGGHKKNARLLSILTAAVIVLAIGIGFLSGARAEKSGAAAYEVLRAAGAEVSAVPLPGMPGPIYGTDAERQKAVVAEADRVIAEYGSSAGGRLALLMKGDAQLRLQDADGAIASFQKYLAEVSSDDSLRFGALEGLALALEAKGKLDEAATAWERMAREAAPYAGQADLERARVLTAAGKKDEARKLLEGFAERHKGSPLATDAAERLARLGAK